jgi:hypothetical protein
VRDFSIGNSLGQRSHALSLPTCAASSPAGQPPSRAQLASTQKNPLEKKKPCIFFPARTSNLGTWSPTITKEGVVEYSAN